MAALLGKRNLHEEKTTRRLSQSCAWNATGGPRNLFQVVQIVNTAGLSQFLIIIQRVSRRRRPFETANQSRIGNCFLLNFCWHQILQFRYAYAYVYVVPVHICDQKGKVSFFLCLCLCLCHYGSHLRFLMLMLMFMLMLMSQVWTSL